MMIDPLGLVDRRCPLFNSLEFIHHVSTNVIDHQQKNRIHDAKANFPVTSPYSSVISRHDNGDDCA